jgi:SNF2 family DNA or RNA helicase
LGKTIIACTILAELKIRDLANRVLIIVPPSLVSQWQSELSEKFNFDFPVVGTSRGDWDQDNFITSVNLVTMNPAKVLNREWDLVIVDEAHRIKNRTSKIWQTVNQIIKKYMLFLTATPMENQLEDIYNLVTLLKPGLLGTLKEFRKQFAVHGNPHACSDPIELRRNLNAIMVRRRRGDLKGLFFPKRVARTVEFDLGTSERRLYEGISDYVVTSYGELEQVPTDRKAVAVEGDTALATVLEKYNMTQDKFFSRKIWLHKFTLMMLQRRVCSSAPAAGRTLQKMIDAREEHQYDLESVPTLVQMEQLAQEVAHAPSTKLQRLKTILDRLPHKAVLYTEFKDSLDYLVDQLQTSGYNLTVFDGTLSSAKRAAVVHDFEHQFDLMLSTDAGSEGLNLQFANTVINWDLPWNPMRVEQRIGRVYRLTQAAEKVFIFNLASKATIEEYVKDVLLDKIGVFSTILGDLNHLLGPLIKTNEDGRSAKLESEIMHFFVQCGHSEKLQQELESLITPVVDKIQEQEEISQEVLDVSSIIGTY